MFKNIAAIVFLSALCTVASADFRTVSRAYEATLDGFRLPVTENGTLGFRACETCDRQSLRVTNTTRYIVNDRVVDLKEFRSEVLQIRDRKFQAVIVEHDLEADVVTSVSVNS
ncbi:hypothetical protein [Woeseia oceani]|uniref:Uncharacterized protein n=1 Tax=Woeseia oceani TaxID=1548547 RepID=A0A193LGN8_9GAMM|nr:hypothetical protein [Woeseia oceani]ANO51710.1 hypothetical protein BA177_11305 [Woeseia oceani]